MDPIECIRTRRSVRKFRPTKIPEIVLCRILEAACWAPSSGNLQNWRFIIVEDEERKKIITRAAYGQDWMVPAPVLVIVCSETGVVSAAYGERGKELYAVQNVAAAIQNILLAANNFGVASCWIAAFSEPLIRKECRIPDFIDIHAILALGYPEKIPRAPPRIDVADVLYFEHWGEIGRGKEVFPLLTQIPSATEQARLVWQRHRGGSESALKEGMDKVIHHIKKITKRKKSTAEPAVRHSRR